MTLVREDKALLRLANRYGDGLDLSGPRVAPMVKARAKNLLLSGHLHGTIKNLCLTDKGRAEMGAEEEE